MLKTHYTNILTDLENWKSDNGLLAFSGSFFTKYASLEDFQKQIKTTLALMLPIYQMIAVMRCIAILFNNFFLAAINLACLKPIDFIKSVSKAISYILCTIPIIFIPSIHAVQSLISIPTRFIATVIPCNIVTESRNTSTYY